MRRCLLGHHHSWHRPRQQRRHSAAQDKIRGTDTKRRPMSRRLGTDCDFLPLFCQVRDRGDASEEKYSRLDLLGCSPVTGYATQEFNTRGTGIVHVSQHLQVGVHAAPSRSRLLSCGAWGRFLSRTCLTPRCSQTARLDKAPQLSAAFMAPEVAGSAPPPAPFAALRRSGRGHATERPPGSHPLHSAANTTRQSRRMSTTTHPCSGACSRAFTSLPVLLDTAS